MNDMELGPIPEESDEEAARRFDSRYQDWWESLDASHGQCGAECGCAEVRS